MYFGPSPVGTSSSFQTTASFDPGPVAEGIYYLRVRTEANNGLQADWPAQGSPLFTFRYDGTPPAANLSAAATRGLTLPFTWSAADALSGVRDYDVAYKDVIAPTWTSLLTATARTGTELALSDGHQNQVRVRATDQAGNTSAWVESGVITVQAVTKCYLFNGQRVAMRSGAGVPKWAAAGQLGRERLAIFGLRRVHRPDHPLGDREAFR